MAALTHIKAYTGILVQNRQIKFLTGLCHLITLYWDSYLM